MQDGWFFYETSKHWRGWWTEERERESGGEEQEDDFEEITRKRFDKALVKIKKGKALGMDIIILSNE